MRASFYTTFTSSNNRRPSSPLFWKKKKKFHNIRSCSKKDSPFAGDSPESLVCHLHTSSYFLSFFSFYPKRKKGGDSNPPAVASFDLYFYPEKKEKCFVHIGGAHRIKKNGGLFTYNYSINILIFYDPLGFLHVLYTTSITCWFCLRTKYKCIVVQRRRKELKVPVEWKRNAVYINETNCTSAQMGLIVDVYSRNPFWNRWGLYLYKVFMIEFDRNWRNPTDVYVRK